MPERIQRPVPDLMANLRASLERARAAREATSESVSDIPETSATQADGTTNTR